METYNPLIIPQSGLTPNNPTIKIQLELYGIMGVDEMQSQIVFKAAFRQWWNDTRLMWKPKDYNGIDTIYLKSDPQIDQRSWTSDMYLRQDAGSSQLSDLKYSDVVVKYTGECYLSQIGQLSVFSSFDTTKFPNDEQEISMIFGSWNYPDNILTVVSHSVPLLVQSTWKINNIEWEFKSYRMEKMSTNISSGNYTRYNFIVTIQRSGGTIMVAVTIPGAIITFLGLLYVLLPRGNGDRANYLSTVLLTEIMFLVMITNFIPLSKIIPTLGWLFLSYTILLSLLMIAILILEKIQSAFVEEVEDVQKEIIKEQKYQFHNLRSKVAAALDEKESGTNKYQSAFDSSTKKIMNNQVLDTEMAEKVIMQSKIKKDMMKELKIRLRRVKKIINKIDFTLFGCSIIVFIVITATFMPEILQTEGNLNQ